MYDYAVVGAGVVGLATAYHIKRLRPGARVILVDKAPGPGMGDTARSAAAFRTAFTARINRLLAKTSIEYYRSLQESGADLGMRWVGYLFLTPSSAGDVMRAVVRELREMGSRVDVLERPEMPVRFEVSSDEEAREMGLEDVAFAVLVRDAGIMDPEKLVRHYHEEYLKAGGEVLYGAEVSRVLARPRRPLGIPGEPFPWQDLEIHGVETSRGVVEARNVVLATGAWTERMASGMGFGLPLRPRKRQVFAVRASGGLKDLLYRDLTGGGAMPMLILPRGVYVRPEPGEGSFWIGVADRRPFGLEEDPQPEEWLWRFGIYPVLTKYVPEFEGATPHNSWAGHYDENVVDYQPVVDRLAPGLYVAAGTSGSGIMKADAIGRVAAGLVLDMPSVELYGGVEVPTDLLKLNRCVEGERLVI